VKLSLLSFMTPDYCRSFFISFVLLSFVVFSLLANCVTAGVINDTILADDNNILYDGTRINVGNGGYEITLMRDASITYTFNGTAIFVYGRFSLNGGRVLFDVDSERSVSLESEPGSLIPFAEDDSKLMFSAQQLDEAKFHILTVKDADDGHENMPIISLSYLTVTRTASVVANDTRLDSSNSPLPQTSITESIASEGIGDFASSTTQTSGIYSVATTSASRTKVAALLSDSESGTSAEALATTSIAQVSQSGSSTTATKFSHNGTIIAVVLGVIGVAILLFVTLCFVRRQRNVRVVPPERNSGEILSITERRIFLSPRVLKSNSSTVLLNNSFESPSASPLTSSFRFEDVDRNPALVSFIDMS